MPALWLAAAAAAALWVAAAADAASARTQVPGALGRLLPALLLNAGAAAVAFLEGAVTRAGAVAGTAIGVMVYVGTGWEGWIFFGVAITLAFAASAAGWGRKTARGIEQEGGGRRGAPHALANCGVAGVAALVAVTSPDQAAAWVAFAAAMTAASADTVASEVGKAWGRRTWLPFGGRVVPPGSPGGISAAGTAANIAAAAALASLAAALGLIPATLIALVTLTALAGAFVESVLAAAFEPRGLLDNHQLNFLNTAAAAALALALRSHLN